MTDRNRARNRVALGDVVHVVTDFWDRSPDRPERFVAGEHIDEGDLRIRRWGMTSDELVPPTFNRRFRAGDVLFHSRNLKKLACPDFDGITGEKLFVLRSKDPNRLLPELLPFLLQTKAFSEYANRMWAGSTNKFLNKAPLIKYDFELPPLEEQQRAILALNSASNLVVQLDAVLRTHRTLADAHTHSLLSGASLRSARSATLGAACKRIGVGIASSASHAYRTSGIPFIRNTNVKPGCIDATELLFVDPAFAELHRSKRVFKGDVVMTRTATDVPGDAAVVPPELDGAQAFTILICTPNEKVLDSAYLCHWINGPPGRAFVRTRRGGAKQQNLGATLLAEMPIQIPSLADQRSIVGQLEELHLAGRRILQRLEAARRLIAAIQKEAFG